MNTKVKEIVKKLYQSNNILVWSDHIQELITNHHKTQAEWEIHSGNDLINYKTQGERKIQLTMIVNFMSSKDFDEIRTMHTKGNNMKIMMSNETNKTIEEPLEFLLQRRIRRKNERKWICFW